MRAAVLKSPGGLENLTIEERDIPRPGLGQVLLKVSHSSLNYRDYALASGILPAPDGRILMSDGAGEVVAAGPGVTTFKQGDKVISAFFPNWSGGAGTGARRSGVAGAEIDGFAAEYAIYPEAGLMRPPKGYTLAEAATLPCAAVTAWRSIMVVTTTRPGDVVLVQGSGGVSIFALQFAKAAGATVIATTSSADKARRLNEIGADHVINYVDTQEWGRAAVEWTGGRGVDTVVEVGGAGTLPQSIAAAAVGGHISLVGILTGVNAELPTTDLVRKNLGVTGISVGSHDDQRAMLRAIEANGIKPVIDRHFPLEAIAEAFAYQAAHKHFGKVVLDVADCST